MTVARTCTIVDASIGHTEDAGDDGAYDLLDATGTPEEIGKAIAESLAACDLTRGPTWGYLEHGQPVWVVVKIKISPASSPDAFSMDVVDDKPEPAAGSC